MLSNAEQCGSDNSNSLEMSVKILRWETKMLCYCRVTAFIPDRDNFHAFHTIPQHGAKKFMDSLKATQREQTGWGFCDVHICTRVRYCYRRCRSRLPERCIWGFLHSNEFISGLTATLFTASVCLLHRLQQTDNNIERWTLCDGKWNLHPHLESSRHV